ncbi:transcriptional repressor LexA [bacterium]|nr:transcriptional repressor LexA [bacterium]
MESKLTKKQQEVFDKILELIQDQGYSPTVREIGTALKKAPSTIHKIILTLENKGFISRRKGSSRGISVENQNRSTTFIPILGSIAAGDPIIAEEHFDGCIEIDSSIVGRGEHFALKVKGDSMIEANILDGDTAIIRSTPEARSGEIIAVLINNEATLKRLSLDNGQPMLYPENRAYQPIELTEKKGPVRILGRLTAVIRKY